LHKFGHMRAARKKAKFAWRWEFGGARGRRCPNRQRFSRRGLDTDPDRSDLPQKRPSPLASTILHAAAAAAAGGTGERERETRVCTLAAVLLVGQSERVELRGLVCEWVGSAATSECARSPRANRYGRCTARRRSQNAPPPLQPPPNQPTMQIHSKCSTITNKILQKGSFNFNFQFDYFTNYNIRHTTMNAKKSRKCKNAVK